MTRSFSPTNFVFGVLLFLFGSLTTPTLALNANCSATDPTNTCIRVGYFRWVPIAGAVQAQVIVGYNEMMDWYIHDHINTTQRGLMSGIPVAFIPYVIPVLSAAAADVKKAAALWIPANGTRLVDFVILPPGSNWAESTGGAMLTFENARVPAIASNSPLSSLFQCPSSKTADISLSKPCKTHSSRRFQFAHGISNAGEQFFQPWIGLLQLKKAKTIAIIQTGATTSIYPGVTQGLISAAADYSIDIVYITNATLVNTNQIAQAELDRIVGELIALQPDGVALASVACAPWILAFQRADYMPSSVVTILCTDSDAIVTSLGDRLNFVVGTAQWNPRMNGNDYLENQDEQPWALFPHKIDGQVNNLTSPMQFVQMWQRITGSVGLPGYTEASILSAFTMLEGAIELTMSQGNAVPDPVLVNQQLQLYYQPSYFGIISTNRYGENQQKAMVMNQRDANGNLGVISPATSASFDFIYPAPKFSERVYTSKMLATPVEWMVIAVLCAAATFTLALMAYLVKNRHQQAFQAAGLPFYLLMGAGCITAYGGVLLWGVENNQQTCNARIWVWTIGFHMYVAPLLASSWRISRIFAQKLKTVKLTNRVVGLISLAIFAPQLLINIMWQTLAPFQATIVTSDILRPASTSFTTCSGGRAGLVFTGVTLAYSALLLLLGCYLAYKIRKAYRLFNDARPIAMSMYIFSVTAAIMMVIQVALNTDNVSVQKVLFGLRSIGVILAYQSSLALLYLRRILGSEQVTKYGGGGGGGRNKLNEDGDSSETTHTPKSAPPAKTTVKSGEVTQQNLRVQIRGSPAIITPAPAPNPRLLPSPPPSIIRLGAPIPLPSRVQFDAMGAIEQFTLLEQFSTQLETLRSQIRTQNLQKLVVVAAVVAPEDDPLLPNTAAATLQCV